jgi:hypothetical protein
MQSVLKNYNLKKLIAKAFFSTDCPPIPHFFALTYSAGLFYLIHPAQLSRIGQLSMQKNVGLGAICAENDFSLYSHKW